MKTTAEKKPQVCKGNYTTLTITPEDDLVIELTEEGREYLSDKHLSGSRSIGDDGDFIELIEEHRCNSSWEEVRPEEIGALTSSLILTYDARRDDDGELLECGTVWAWDYYSTDLFMETLKTVGKMTWKGYE